MSQLIIESYPHLCYLVRIKIMELSHTLTESVQTVANLHEKAISFLEDAALAAEEGRIEDRWNAAEQVHGILLALRVSLDTEKGGKIAKNLEHLYTFMKLRLMDLNVHNTASAATDIINLLKPLSDSWKQLSDEIATDPKRLIH